MKFQVTTVHLHLLTLCWKDSLSMALNMRELISNALFLACSFAANSAELVCGSAIDVLLYHANDWHISVE